MGSSLRDIPGAGGGRRKQGLGKVGGGPASKPWQPPPKIQAAGKRKQGPAIRFQGPRKDIDRFNVVLVLAFAALFVVGGVWLLRSNRVTVSSGDFGDGDAVTTANLADLEIDVNIEPSSRRDAATVRFEGEEVTDDLEETDSGFRWTPPDTGLEEGTYELEVSVPKPVFGSTDWSMTFGVDDTAPVVHVDPPDDVGIGDEVTLRGEVDERVDLEAVDRTVEVDEDGRFSITFDNPPAGAIAFVATDPAGNRSSTSVTIPVAPPSTRAAFVTADGWNDEGVRDGVLALLDDGTLDGVVLDVKDECGVVTYDSGLDLPAQVGAEDARFDLEDAIGTVHDHGGHVIARVVTFRDPMLARWGWANGHQDWVLQDTANDPWPEYGDGEGCPERTNAEPIVGGFTNVASNDVWNYNIDIAEEVAELGADDVLLDDVRRPAGDLANMNAVGMEPTATYVGTFRSFLAKAHRRLRDHGVYLGASISGLSVRDPATYDQDLGEFAPAVDYLAPEVYPESYSSGYFNLPDPQAAPGMAVQGAVQAATDQLDGGTTPVVPWLQDYSSAVPYGLTEIQAQVDGAAAAGACSWILRDPEFTFTAGITSAC
jgi:hypothetical protein